jgi:outer membrane protein OmpA-like peptidoglycan-associated protein
MRRLLIGAVLALLAALPFPAPATAQDIDGAKENAWFSRMPTMVIDDFEEKDFDAYIFFDGKKEVTVEGKLNRIHFSRSEDGKKYSALQVRRNYTAAIKAAGGQVIFEGTHDEFADTRSGGVLITGRFRKGEREIWVEVWPSDYENGAEYWLTTLEVEAMQQEVSASDIFDALQKEGRIVLSILFDTGKAIIKPESDPIVAEIVTVLRQNPALKIAVEGHTDNAGNAAANRKLSEDRAKAVVAAIVKQGVDAKRLTSTGFGQERPIADNATEEGRAKNRRVELVRK